ncbi:methyl-accepting chemotaxis protein [Oscillatoria acuminata]|uniref:Methyl-accepting chemotaxis protein n=1 Tax=Oscillatoria acuminata PCC 6304 TaxID=56110 RepID=K9TCB6_9CYAN|nr:methyl-accepting chemotaxis protein [Oscillatoria acuminata]AFY80068.1 methyl-accepting chemotaxis protein [Oscillatoria acuminata PCC 6304]
MFANLKLRNQMVLGYGLPIAIAIAGFMVVTYESTQKVSQSFEKVELIQARLLTLNDITHSSLGLVREARGYLVNGNPEYLNRYYTAVSTFENLVNETKELYVLPEERKVIQEMIDLTKNYITFFTDVRTLYDAGKKEEAIELWTNQNGLELVTRFKELTLEFEDQQKALLIKENEKSIHTLQILLLWITLGCLLLVSIAVIVALVISSSIARIIRQETHAIASASTQIASTVEQHERTLSQQATSVNETSATMTELGSSSTLTAEQAQFSENNANQVLQLAESSVQGAQEVLTLADRGIQAVERTQEGMSVLTEKVEAIALQILRLSEQTNQISNITSLVSDLAGQTNMLALNAAVEAVRAGENGKGFSVIATEIRKLADQSKTSAQKISTLIVNIESAIDSTVTVTEDGKRKAQESIILSRETAEAFSKVTEAINDVILTNQQVSLNAINDVVLNSRQISLTTKQQAVAINQVVTAMNDLNQGATETVNGINQTKIGIHKLNETAQNLNALV